jgi:hypothetical protein
VKSAADALVNVRRVAYEKWRISGEKRRSCEREERIEAPFILVIIFPVLASCPIWSYADDWADYSTGGLKWIVSLPIVQHLPGLWP